MRLIAMALVATLASPAPAAPGDRWDGGTLAYQAGAGVVGGLIGAGIGGLIGTGVATGVGNDARAGRCLLAVGAIARATDRLHPPALVQIAIGAVFLVGMPVVGYQLSAAAPPPVMPLVSVAF